MMDGRISFADSRAGKTRVVIECRGTPDELSRAEMYVSPRLGDAVESMSQWVAERAFFVELRDEDALTALRTAVDVLDVLRANGLLNLHDEGGEQWVSLFSNLPDPQHPKRPLVSIMVRAKEPEPQQPAGPPYDPEHPDDIPFQP